MPGKGSRPAAPRPSAEGRFPLRPATEGSDQGRRHNGSRAAARERRALSAASTLVGMSSAARSCDAGYGAIVSTKQPQSGPEVATMSHSPAAGKRKPLG